MKNCTYQRWDEKHRIPCRDLKMASNVARMQYLFEIEDGFVGTFEEYEELFFAHIEENEQPNRAARREMKRSK